MMNKLWIDKILQRASEDISLLTGTPVSVSFEYVDEVKIKPYSREFLLEAYKIFCVDFGIGKIRSLHNVMHNRAFVSFMRVNYNVMLVCLGKVMGLNYTTIIHHLKKDKEWIECKDERYMAVREEVFEYLKTNNEK